MGLFRSWAATARNRLLSWLSLRSSRLLASSWTWCSFLAVLELLAAQAGGQPGPEQGPVDGFCR